MDIFSTGLTSSALLSAVSSNMQDVLANIAPIIELVIGVVLAFVLARYLISLFSATGTTGTGGHVKSDLNMYHHSDAEMRSTGMDPMEIQDYDEGNF
jgi:hypothetical protein